MKLFCQLLIGRVVGNIRIGNQILLKCGPQDELVPAKRGLLSETENRSQTAQVSGFLYRSAKVKRTFDDPNELTSSSGIKDASSSAAQAKNRLAEFHKKLSTLKFLDPACGCGNFLVITYRELRLLELEILRASNKRSK